MLWLPKWLQWFRWDIDKHRETDIELYMSLMNQVRRKMADGTAQPSMATIALGKQAEFGLAELETAYTLSGPWDAGVSTVRHIVSTVFRHALTRWLKALITIENFLRKFTVDDLLNASTSLNVSPLVAMLHYPDVCAKLQAELDRVVGPGRLPEYSDMESLPYMMAALKEVTR